MVKQVYDAIEELRRGGVTILIVEQSVGRALKVADRTYVLNSGAVTISGRSAELQGTAAFDTAYFGAMSESARAMIVLQNAIDAISLGAVYALAALGIGLIFSIMRLINFAHGELIMVGGFMLYGLAGQPYIVMALAAILVVSILALGMERLAFRPLRNANPATLLISSFAVSYLVQHIVLMAFGARPMGVDFMAQLGESVGSRRPAGAAAADRDDRRRLWR